MSRRQIHCEHWDDTRGWCPASFVGDEASVLQAAEQHMAGIHHRPSGPRLRRELRARLGAR